MLPMPYTKAGVIHMHSDYSHDGIDALETLRDVCIARNIRWVGMTDHAEDFIPDVFEEYVSHCAALSDDALSIIPGLEYKFSGFRGVHVLAIGLTEWINPKSFEEFFHRTESTACFTVLAHPVLCKYRPPQVVLDEIDAIEIWNTRYNTRYLPDPRSISLYHDLHARRPGIVATVGLDQHDSRNDGGVRTLIPADDLAAPISALRAGRFATTGRGSAFDSRASMTPAELRDLRLKRSAFDPLNRLYGRATSAIRRLGLDP